MIIPILTTILATTIVTNGIHARATMEPPMVKTASNERDVDGPFAKPIDLSALVVPVVQNWHYSCLR